MKKLRFLLIVPLFFFGAPLLEAQEKYWVLFTDKEGVSFDPHTYFDPLAIERRIKHNIPLNHYTDRPVREDYITQIGLLSDSLTATTRWFNGVAGYFSTENIRIIEKLPFVHEVIPIQSTVALAFAKEESDGVTLTFGAAKLAKAQLTLMGGQYFEENNFNGKGIRIAVFDAGFPGVDMHETFSHIRNRNGIKATYDFVKNREFVYSYSAHGTMTLSCIGGIFGGQKLGMATGADFLLARTEIGNREPLSEEENWLQAAEWADKHGAHIINSSLGYTEQRYFQKDMTGKKTLVTRAGNMAASKGILVVNAAGNEGSGSWTIIGAPADADSVLAVGGLNPWTGIHTSFGSYGPTADGRLKPNVCAPAYVIAQGKKNIQEVPGTSFSSPLTSGFAACLLHSNPNMLAMELFRAIEQSGNLYPFFDYAHGYGTPQGDKALKIQPPVSATFDVSEKNDYLVVTIKPDQLEIIYSTYSLRMNNGKGNREHPDDEGYNSSTHPPLPQIPPYFYWHLEDKDGKLTEYEVVLVQEEEVFKIPLSYLAGKKIRMHYKGYTEEKMF